jgi:cytochrome c553
METAVHNTTGATLAASISIALAVTAMAPAPGGPVPHTAEGERLTYTLGCVSCHNADLTGHMVEEDTERMLAWSTNLTLKLPGWSDADIARALRAGKRPDGSDIWVMPVHTFHWINDDEMRDLVVFLRSLPRKGVEHPAAVFGPRARAAIASGRAKSPAGSLADDLAKAPPPLGQPEGRRMTLMICGDCHGPDLKGYDGEGAPPALVIAANYNLPDFTRLLHTGARPDGQASGMTPAAKERLFKLTDGEITLIWNYLQAFAAQQPKPVA